MRVLLLIASLFAPASIVHGQDFLAVAVDRRPVPGLPGVAFDGDVASFAVDGSGRVVFTMGARGPIGGGDAIWLLTPLGIEMVAGPDIAGVTRTVPATLNIRNADRSYLFFDDDGVIYILCSVNGEHGIFAIDTGLSGTTPGVTPIAVEGQAAPGGGTFTSVASGFQARRGGILAFAATAGGVESAYLFEDGSLEVAVSVGDAVAGQTLLALRTVFVDERGYVYFDGTTDGAGGIFRYASGALGAVVVPEMAFGSLGGISLWNVLPTAGVVVVSERWIDDGGGGFASERLVQRIGDSGSTDLVTPSTALDGGTYAGASNVSVISDGHVVIHGSVDDGGASATLVLIEVTSGGATVSGTRGESLVDGTTLVDWGNVVAVDGLAVAEIYGASGRSLRYLPDGSALPLVSAGDYLLYDPDNVGDGLAVTDAILFRGPATGPIGRTNSGSGTTCVLVYEDANLGLACNIAIAPSSGGDLTLTTDLQAGSLVGSAMHVGGTASLGLEAFMTSAPTWSIEGTFSAPLVGGRVLVTSDDVERPEICEFRTNAAGLATGFVCSQADSTTFPLTSEVDIALFFDANLPVSGVPDDVLTVQWTSAAESEGGDALDPVMQTDTLDAPTADVGVRAEMLPDGQQRLTFEIVDDADTEPVVIWTDDPLLTVEGCDFVEDAMGRSCETVLLSSDLPFIGLTQSASGLARVTLQNSGFFPVDPNPANDEARWGMGTGGDDLGGGCEVADVRDVTWVPLAALVLLVAMRRRR